MPSLQIRELPTRLYQALKELAEQERRSLSQQAIVVLARGMNLEPDPQRRRRILIEKFKQNADRWDHYAWSELVARIHPEE